jgi:NADH dehydrogenase
VRGRLRGQRTPPFRYHDKGNLATIGRRAAVADINGVRLSGSLAWITWLLVHIWYLVGFENRVVVFVRWSSSFLTHGRSARLITETEARPQAGGRSPSPDSPAGR